MSLQVWLPLTKDLHNQGLLGKMPESTDQGATNPFSQVGKIGNCLAYDNDYVTKIQDLSNNNLISLFGTGHVFSVAFWFKLKGVGTSAFLFQIGARINNKTFGLWWTSSTSGQGPRLVWNDGNSGTSTGMYVSAGYNTAIDYENWHHFVATIDKRDQTQEVEKYYLDGQLIKTQNYDNSSAEQLVTDASNNFVYLRPRYAMFNDFRIYNHFLSAKEVEEIAKGLVLHYKLDNIYNSSYTNIYDAPYSEGSGSTDYNSKTKLANENGYNYQLTYTGTGASIWKWITFPNFTFTAGKNYYFTCKVRCNACSNMQVSFRPARVANDYAQGSWAITVASQALADGQWHTYEKIMNIPATVVRNDSTITSNPRIEFLTSELKTSNTVYSVNLDIKDIAVIETDEPIEFIDNRFKTSTIYDSSGYGNHGTIVGSLTTAAPSPRYTLTTKFDGASYIKTNSISTELYTVSLWVKWLAIPASGSYSLLYHDWVSGLSIGYSGTTNRLACVTVAGASTADGYVFTPTVGVWYHIVAVKTGAETRNIYINGSAVTPAPGGGWAGDLNEIYIGARHFNDYNSFLDGFLTDVRVYAAPLTANQVKELYTTSMSIDASGNIHARELVEL